MKRLVLALMALVLTAAGAQAVEVEIGAQMILASKYIFSMQIFGEIMGMV